MNDMTANFVVRHTVDTSNPPAEFLQSENVRLVRLRDPSAEGIEDSWCIKIRAEDGSVPEATLRTLYIDFYRGIATQSYFINGKSGTHFEAYCNQQNINIKEEPTEEGLQLLEEWLLDPEGGNLTRSYINQLKQYYIQDVGSPAITIMQASGLELGVFWEVVYSTRVTYLQVEADVLRAHTSLSGIGIGVASAMSPKRIPGQVFSSGEFTDVGFKIKTFETTDDLLYNALYSTTFNPENSEKLKSSEKSELIGIMHAEDKAKLETQLYALVSFDFSLLLSVNDKIKSLFGNAYLSLYLNQFAKSKSDASSTDEGQDNPVEDLATLASQPENAKFVPLAEAFFELYSIQGITEIDRKLSVEQLINLHQKLVNFQAEFEKIAKPENVRGAAITKNEDLEKIRFRISAAIGIVSTGLKAVLEMEPEARVRLGISDATIATIEKQKKKRFSELTKKKAHIKDLSGAERKFLDLPKPIEFNAGVTRTIAKVEAADMIDPQLMSELKTAAIEFNDLLSKFVRIDQLSLLTIAAIDQKREALANAFSAISTRLTEQERGSSGSISNLNFSEIEDQIQNLVTSYVDYRKQTKELSIVEYHALLKLKPINEIEISDATLKKVLDYDLALNPTHKPQNKELVFNRHKLQEIFNANKSKLWVRMHNAIPTDLDDLQNDLTHLENLNKKGGEFTANLQEKGRRIFFGNSLLIGAELSEKQRIKAREENLNYTLTHFSTGLLRASYKSGHFREETGEVAENSLYAIKKTELYQRLLTASKHEIQQLWTGNPALWKMFQLDKEIALSLARKNLNMSIFLLENPTARNLAGLTAEDFKILYNNKDGLILTHKFNQDFSDALVRSSIYKEWSEDDRNGFEAVHVNRGRFGRVKPKKIELQSSEVQTSSLEPCIQHGIFAGLKDKMILGSDPTTLAKAFDFLTKNKSLQQNNGFLQAAASALTFDVQDDDKKTSRYLYAMLRNHPEVALAYARLLEDQFNSRSRTLKLRLTENLVHLACLDSSGEVARSILKTGWGRKVWGSHISNYLNGEQLVKILNAHADKKDIVDLVCSDRTGFFKGKNYKAEINEEAIVNLTAANVLSNLKLDDARLGGDVRAAEYVEGGYNFAVFSNQFLAYENNPKATEFNILKNNFERHIVNNGEALKELFQDNNALRFVQKHGWLTTENILSILRGELSTSFQLRYSLSSQEKAALAEEDLSGITMLPGTDFAKVKESQRIYNEIKPKPVEPAASYDEETERQRLKARIDGTLGVAPESHIHGISQRIFDGGLVPDDPVNNQLFSYQLPENILRQYRHLTRQAIFLGGDLAFNVLSNRLASAELIHLQISQLIETRNQILKQYFLAEVKAIRQTNSDWMNRFTEDELALFLANSYSSRYNLLPNNPAENFLISELGTVSLEYLNAYNQILAVIVPPKTVAELWILLNNFSPEIAVIARNQALDPTNLAAAAKAALQCLPDGSPFVPDIDGVAAEIEAFQQVKTDLVAAEEAGSTGADATDAEADLTKDAVDVLTDEQKKFQIHRAWGKPSAAASADAAAVRIAPGSAAKSEIKSDEVHGSYATTMRRASVSSRSDGSLDSPRSDNAKITDLDEFNEMLRNELDVPVQLDIQLNNVIAILHRGSDLVKKLSVDIIIQIFQLTQSSVELGQLVESAPIQFYLWEHKDAIQDTVNRELLNKLMQNIPITEKVKSEEQISNAIAAHQKVRDALAPAPESPVRAGGPARAASSPGVH